MTTMHYEFVIIMSELFLNLDLLLEIRKFLLVFGVIGNNNLKKQTELFHEILSWGRSLISTTSGLKT